MYSVIQIHTKIQQNFIAYLLCTRHILSAEDNDRYRLSLPSLSFHEVTSYESNHLEFLLPCGYNMYYEADRTIGRNGFPKSSY